MTRAVLGTVLADARAGFPYGQDEPDGVLQVRMNNVTRDGRWDLSKQRRVSSQVKRLDDFLLQPGDVLFNATNSPDIVGKSAFFAGLEEPAVFSNHFLRLRPTTSLLDGRYLAQWLRFHFERGLFRRLCRQWVNQAAVAREDLLALQIDLPPVDEQRRVAEALVRTDVLVDRRRVASTSIDDVVRAVFLDLFLDAEERGWPSFTVAELAAPEKGAIRTGPFGSQLLHSEFVDDGVAVLGIDNVVTNRFRWAGRRFVTQKKYDQLRRYTVQPGDVLITIMGTCGRCAVVPPDIPLAVNTKHLCCITLDQDRCLPEFLQAYFLWHPTALRYLTQRGKGAIMEGLNMGIIKELPVVLPPISLQADYTARLQVIGSIRAKNQRSAEHIDELFSALQYQAFNGAGP